MQNNDGQIQDELRDQMVHEIRNTPMFQAPDMWVSGSARHLSPLQFFACTNEPRVDLDGLDIDGFGLTEERCTTVEKNGVRLMNHFYSSVELLPYMTGDKKVQQRNAFVRYDRALAARGVLRQVEFLLRNEHGIAVERFTLHRDGSAPPGMSRDDLMRARNAYVKTLLRRRDEAQHAVITMNGPGFADKLINETKARARRQKKNGGLPAPAAPIFAPISENDDELGHALDQSESYPPPAVPEEAWARPQTPGKVTGPVHHDAGAEEGEDGSTAPTSGATSSQSEDELSALDEVLGGSVGFLKD